jgi:DNA mismatch repair protein MutS
MVVDEATLRDLAVLWPSVPQGATLIGLIDRTTTRAGREQLRRRVRSPLQSAEAIVALQAAQQALAAHTSRYATIIQRTELDSLERYLTSTWKILGGEPAARRLVRRMWQAPWYRDYLLEVSRGQTRVVAVFGAASALREELAGTGSVVLEQLATSIAKYLSSSELSQLKHLAADSSRSGRLAFDRLARQEAAPLLTGLIECLGTIEAIVSLAMATRECRWIYPRPASRLRVSGLVHPFHGDAGTKTTLDLDADVRVCFVTGPNMAGKSTFLKTVAVALLLAHIGCGVPAEAMEFPVFGTLFTSVQIAENLHARESFYLAEVRRMRDLAVAIHDSGPAFAIIDEPFRGTNIHDATEATLAVTTRLTAQPATLAFLASHLAEIAPQLAQDGRVRFLNFAATLTNGEPTFDYQLRDGVSHQRLGMTLLERESVLDLLDRAANRASVK